jgi:glycosyltransferase involved in cell wall biosynthesis
MKIGILTLSSPDSGGIFQYTISMLEALKLITYKYNFIQIRHKDFPKILNDANIIEKPKNSINLMLRHVIHVFTNISLGNIAPKINVDFIISPTITLLPFHMKKPYIVTIHDFQHEYFPEFFTLKQRIGRKIIYKTGQKANMVICESNYVKRDIIKFLKVPEKKIKVLPSPPPNYIQKTKIDETKFKEIKEKYNLPDNFLFYPAHFWYHKNHINLIRAIKLIKNKYGQNIPLILVGSIKNNFENIIKEIQNLELSQQVKYLGYVPDEDMPYLYKLATALVMPTLFESVSIPIWEAFHLGCPVVSSNVCALPEQVGDAGLIFDPHNIEDMAEKIYIVWTNAKLRESLVQKGYERVKDLTIENYAKQWEKILEEVL